MLVIYKMRSIQIKIAVYCCLSGGIYTFGSYRIYTKACVRGGVGTPPVRPHISGVHRDGEGG
jgi:hypothetical protein